MRGVSDHALRVRRDRNVELDGVGVGLDEILGMLLDGPGQPSIEVLHDSELGGDRFVVVDLDLEALGDYGIGVVAVKIRLMPLADQVEGVAGVDAQCLVFGRVITRVVAQQQRCCFSCILKA